MGRLRCFIRYFEIWVLETMWLMVNCLYLVVLLGFAFLVDWYLIGSINIGIFPMILEIFSLVGHSPFGVVDLPSS